MRSCEQFFSRGIRMNPSMNNDCSKIIKVMADYQLRIGVVRSPIQVPYKQMQMAEGDLLQDILAELSNAKSLRGHPDGIDFLDEKRKLVGEIKRSYNTDNASSKKENIAKLVRFVEKHPQYQAFYGYFYGKNGHSKTRIHCHQNIQVVELTGDDLTKFLCQQTVEQIVVKCVSELQTMMYNRSIKF
jgi:hypothetical protein